MSKNKIIIYKSESGKIRLKVKLDQQTIWLNQKQISQLFDTDKTSISRHIKNIFRTKELDKKSNVQKMHTANSDKPVKFYNLDMVISIGYRINSQKTTHFRIWSTNILKKHTKNKKSTKTYLFVDGTNLYASQYQIYGPKCFLNFKKFIKILKSNFKIKFDEIYFYASYSPQKTNSIKEKKYLKNEALFYKTVKQTPKCHFFKGYRSPTSGKEKEVDVKLAVDIVNMAHNLKYKNLFLISGDADFMHALNIAKKLRRNIKIICTENRIPKRFIYKFSTICIKTQKNSKIPKNINIQQILIKKEDIVDNIK